MDDMDDADVMVGPIDYLVVEFSEYRMGGQGLPLLVDLVDRDIIRILDLVLLRKELDGSVTGLSLQDFGDEVELRVFDGVRSGLLGMDDIEEAAKAVRPGCVAGVLVYENRWAAPFATALRRGGAQLVAAGRIPMNEIIAVLDAQTECGSLTE
jgi:hypothetical protein